MTSFQEEEWPSKYAEGERRNMFTGRDGAELEDAEAELWKVVNGVEGAELFLNGESMDAEKLLRLLVRLQDDEVKAERAKVVHLGTLLAQATWQLNTVMEEAARLKKQLKKKGRGKKRS